MQHFRFVFFSITDSSSNIISDVKETQIWKILSDPDSIDGSNNPSIFWFS